MASKLFLESEMQLNAEHRIVVNQITFRYDVDKMGEFNDEASATVPDMALTVPELLDRFTRGLPLPANGAINDEGGMDLPNFDEMDLVEIQEYREFLSSRITEMQAEFEETSRVHSERYLANGLTTDTPQVVDKEIEGIENEAN